MEILGEIPLLLRARDHRGVTLLELLIILTIIAVLALAAAPSFNTLIQEQKIIGATENLYNMLQFARSEAIKRNQTVYVNFQSGSNWCYGTKRSSACTCTTPSGCTAGAVTAPANNILTLSASGLSSNSVAFDGTRGTVGSSPIVTFTITGLSTAMSIKMNILGNMVICSNQVSGYPGC